MEGYSVKLPRTKQEHRSTCVVKTGYEVEPAHVMVSAAREGSMRQFRVVVIDDDAEVLRRVSGRLSTIKREFEGDTWRVDLSTVHVTVCPDESGRYIFADATVPALGAAFSVRPDLVLMDYGYIDPGVLEYWLERDKNGHEITAGDLAGQFLTTVELALEVRAAIDASQLDSAVLAHLQRHFLNFTGPLVLYTMTSRAFLRALGEVEARRVRVDSAFPHAKVTAIDTRYELYNGDEFIGQKHDSGYYAHLVGGLVNREIQVAMLETMLEKARGLKYLRYRRSVFAAGAIVAVGGGIAAVGEFLGSRVGEFMRHGDYPNAAIAVGLALVLVLVMGTLLPLAFGRFMSGLVDKEDSPRN